MFIWNWICRLRITRRPHPLRVIRVSDLPTKIDKRKVYLVGDSDNIWSVAFTCPCGCRDIVYLNALKEVRPCWVVAVHRDQSVTITPSVWRTEGCRSHFFIRKGIVDWA